MIRPPLKDAAMRTLLTAATILISASVLAVEPKIHRDLAYTDPADASRRLDVYAPADGEGHPVLVWLHGGGWRQGDKSAVQKKPQAFVDKGFIFVSVNYRFVPQVTVKEMTGDIAKAIKWVHDHAKQYGGAADKILVAGHSAGAHLAALVCTDGSYLKAEGMDLSAIKGCIPVDTAVYDIPSQLKSVGPLRASTYTSAFGLTEADQKQLSPITHVAKDKDIPPFLILHVADRPDSTAQSQAFAKTLVDAGVQTKVVPGEGKNHGTINRDLGLPDDEPTKAVFEFLDGVLKGH
jgi:acetyl esterase/lipase